jgi:ZIP family zinc transporter
MLFADNVLFALLLCLFAGLSTSLGAFLAFFTRHTNTKALSIALGFSAGVMIYISFVELLPTASAHIIDFFGSNSDFASFLCVLAFFSGLISFAIIDRLVPEFENPHEIREVEEIDAIEKEKRRKLYNTAMISAIVIAFHNFPEGFATFASALSNPTTGIAVAVAIAIHNIPEGIAVSIPFYYATKNRKNAFLLASLSGLAEPIGAVLGFMILYPFMNGALLGLIFAFVAGLMVFISLDELLPSAQKYGHHHLSIYGLIAGMAVMAISLIFL